MMDVLVIGSPGTRGMSDCVESLLRSDHDLRQVSLWLLPDAGAAQEKLMASWGDAFSQIHTQTARPGWSLGRRVNQAAAMGQGEWILCLMPGVSVFPDTLRLLEEEIRQSPDDVAMWELRELPFENPKYYDPVTRHTAFAEGCFAVRRSVFERVRGYDESLQLACETLDLSWRIRAEGYHIRYAPKASVMRDDQAPAVARDEAHKFRRYMNNGVLRWKFGTRAEFSWWFRRFAKMVLRPRLPGFRRQLLHAAGGVIRSFAAATRWRVGHRGHAPVQQFFDWQYERQRDGAAYRTERVPAEETVSVIVRTCGRPSVLRETLISLRWQTYPRLEIVVVEDGAPAAQDMIAREFSDLNIRYWASGTHVGRCAVGNRGLQMASGRYVGFLDDDDVFFADHVETLVGELRRGPDRKIAYALAYQTLIETHSKEPYQYSIRQFDQPFRHDFNRLVLLSRNCFPIQSILFDRSVYEELGGFDETLDMLEDWDLWVRYAMRYPFFYAEKTTSVYRLSASSEAREERQQQMRETLARVQEKHLGYDCGWTLRELREDAARLVERPGYYASVAPVQPIPFE